MAERQIDDRFSQERTCSIFCEGKAPGLPCYFTPERPFKSDKMKMFLYMQH